MKHLIKAHVKKCKTGQVFCRCVQTPELMSRQAMALPFPFWMLQTLIEEVLHRQCLCQYANTYWIQAVRMVPVIYDNKLTRVWQYGNSGLFLQMLWNQIHRAFCDGKT